MNNQERAEIVVHLKAALNILDAQNAKDAEWAEKVTEAERGMAKRITEIEEMVKVQTSHGNWNFDPYMHGLANGLILAHHTMTVASGDSSRPPCLSAPKEWLKDRSALPLSSDGAKGDLAREWHNRPEYGNCPSCGLPAQCTRDEHADGCKFKGLGGAKGEEGNGL